MKITVSEGSVRQELPFEKGETILSVLRKAGIQSISAPCGGKGFCGRCSVFVRSGDSFGDCLACTTPAEDGMTVEIIPEERSSFADQSFGEIYAPSPGQHGYAAACDLGTTTLVFRLLNLETGEQLGSVSASNRQRIFGADVLSRLRSCEEGYAAQLHDLIIRQTEECLRELCLRANLKPEDLRLVSAAGNTVMMHFFAGLDPSAVSTAPFVPLSLFGEMRPARSLGLDLDAQVYLCPAASGFIGSDTLCGILSSSAAEKDSFSLMIDLGTNTEIILGSRDRIFACAADGGAAFRASLLEHGMTASEGAVSGIRLENGTLKYDVIGDSAPKGICGSGFIDLLGILLEEGILDEMGHLAEAEDTDSELGKLIGEENGRPVFYLTPDRTVFLSQADISRFQLAKAGIYAGIRILAGEAGISLRQTDRLLLCGGFGAFVHRRNAALLGMIPRECKGRTVKLGNAALAGAVSAALSEDARRELSRIRERIRVIDLPTHPSFSDEYTDGMMFE